MDTYNKNITYDSLTHFLLEPHTNGMLSFILGSIFVLSVYHIILFFQNKDKSYMYYGLYTLLIFITYCSRSNNSFLYILSKPIHPIIEHYKYILIWLYNTVYFSFGLSFIDLKTKNRFWYLVISRGVYGLLGLGIIGQIITNYVPYPEMISIFYAYIFLPIITLFSLLSFYIILKVDSQLKYYLVIGSAFLFVSSMISTTIVDLQVIDNVYNLGSLIFFIGLIVENIFFSIGLGHKQKLLLIEKNNAQAKLILEYEENQKLKQQLNSELEEKVKILEEKIISEKENHELKMTVFKSQMNPHFLFNSLNAIKHFIIENSTKDAVFYLNKFSKLMRSILENSTKKVFSLQEELDFLELYVTLENIRFSNGIKYSVSVDSNINLLDIQIPALVLQPIIENSIWHGLTLKEGNKTLKLIIRKENTFIKICIEDNGIGRKASEKNKKNQLLKKKSIGIHLTKERLTNYYRNKASLEIIDLYDNRENPLGTLTTISIPVDQD